MNDFKDSLKVERETTGEIIITEQLKNVLVQFMNGEITKKEVMELTGIKDKNTVERKIESIITLNPELIQLYKEYVSKKRENFEGYNFRAEAIDMLRFDYSQSTMAKKIGVSRRSFSTKIKQLQESNEDNILGLLLKQHAERQMRRQQMTPDETVHVNLLLDKYEEKNPVGLAKYEHRTSLEIRRDRLQNVVSTVEDMIKNGKTLKEINDEKIISESLYRKYKEELNNLSKILDGEKVEEQ